MSTDGHHLVPITRQCKYSYADEACFKEEKKEEAEKMINF